MSSFNRICQLVSLIKNEVGCSDQVIVSAFKKALKDEEKKFSERKEEKVVKTDSNICSYVYQRGEKKGEKCIYPVKDGKSYCSRHFKKNTDEKKKEKTCNKKMDNVKAVLRLIKNMKEKDIVIRKNKFDNFETENGLLYDPESREIYAYQGEDGKIRDLWKSEIDWCKERNMKFKYPFNMSLENDNETKSSCSSSDKEETVEVSDDTFYEEELDDDEVNEEMDY
jgi:hypothetical protein